MRKAKASPHLHSGEPTLLPSDLPFPPPIWTSIVWEWCPIFWRFPLETWSDSHFSFGPHLCSRSHILLPLWLPSRPPTVFHTLAPRAATRKGPSDYEWLPSSISVSRSFGSAQSFWCLPRFLRNIGPRSGPWRHWCTPIVECNHPVVRLALILR